jgi:5-methylcytosine-specific restriction endonuclease McrA
MPVRPPIHDPLGFRPGKAPDRRSPAFYHRAKWQQLAASVLARDNYICRLMLPGCKVEASIADHIRERKAGGSDDPSNLRAVCASCHNRRHPEKWRATRD